MSKSRSFNRDMDMTVTESPYLDYIRREIDCLRKMQGNPNPSVLFDQKSPFAAQ